MNLPHTDLQPDDPDRLPPARRRRAMRLLAPLDADERAAFIDQFAHRVSPSFDFYVFSLIAATILSAGLLFDNHALVILGLVLSPLMSPAVGVSLGVVTGSYRLFLRNLVGLVVASIIVFGIAYLAGSLIKSDVIGEFSIAQAQSRLTWPNFLLLAFGSVFTTVFFARGEGKSRFSNAGFASIALTYALFLPLVSAGIGLGARLPYLWPDGLVIFLVNITCGILLGALTLAVMGFRPLSPYGYTLGGALTLLAVILIFGLGSFSAVITARIGLPTATPSLTPTATKTLTPTPSPIPPTSTPTLTFTPTFTLTPTITPSPTSTPVWGLIRSDIPIGARIRSEPGGPTVGFITQNTWVVIIPGTVEKEGKLWIQVITPDGSQGWIVQDLVLRITPTPISTP